MKEFVVLSLLPFAALAAERTFSVVTCGGVPRLAVDGVPCVGTAAMPSPKVAPGKSVTTLADFDRQGIRFYSDIWMMNDRRYLPRVWWRGEGDYDFGTFDALVKGLLDATPDGFVFPRIKLDPPDSWIAAHPEEMFAGTVRPESAAWRTLYRRMLRDMVAHVESAPYADRIAGYHLGALHCGEWVFHGGDYQLSLPADPVARRARSREITHNVAEAVVDAARFLRRLTHGRKLIGSFFGYVSYAHEDLFTVLESKSVDFFAAPPHYREIREIGHSGRSQAYYQASYRLHGSVYYEESDFRTFLSDPTCSFAPATRMRPLGESLAIMRRSIGKCLAGGWENWWFLLGGNATFSHPEMMATVRTGVEEQRRSLHTAWTPADVAVFTSPNEFATSVGAPDLDLRTALKVRMQTETLPSCGVTFDSYVLEDIADPRLPEYSVCFFPNAYTLTPALKAAIERCTNGPGKTAIFIREGEPVPDAAALREKFRAAGAHVWLDSGDILAAGRGYLMIHAASDGEKTIRLPNACDVHEIFGASPDRRNVSAITETLRKGETRVYRLMNF